MNFTYLPVEGCWGWPPPGIGVGPDSGPEVGSGAWVDAGNGCEVGLSPSPGIGVGPDGGPEVGSGAWVDAGNGCGVGLSPGAGEGK